MHNNKILLVNEFVEKPSRQTYKDNYPDTEILPQDIKDLTGFDFLDTIQHKLGELDILDGSTNLVLHLVLIGQRDKRLGSRERIFRR